MPSHPSSWHAPRAARCAAGASRADRGCGGTKGLDVCFGWLGSSDRLDRTGAWSGRAAVPSGVPRRCGGAHVRGGSPWGTAAGRVNAGGCTRVGGGGVGSQPSPPRT
eukprot:scaffold4518_cov410-Prasinococcus_capsulatus_cf.AAC.12